MSKIIVSCCLTERISLNFCSGALTVSALSAPGTQWLCNDELRKAVAKGKGIVSSTGITDTSITLDFNSGVCSIAENGSVRDVYRFRECFLDKLRMIIAKDADYDRWETYFEDTKESIERSPYPLSSEELKEISRLYPTRRVVVKAMSHVRCIFLNGETVHDNPILQIEPKGQSSFWERHLEAFRNFEVFPLETVGEIA